MKTMTNIRAGQNVIRYERRADIHEARLSLASILILWRAVKRLDNS